MLEEGRNKMIRKSIAQDFFLLAVGENGGMAPLRREVSNAGLVAAGVLDLEAAGVIASEKKKVTVLKPLPAELSHLEPLYHYLSEKPRSFTRLMSDYLVGGSARMKAVYESVGKSLLADGAVTEGMGGFFGNKQVYIPDRARKAELVGKLKETLLGGGAVPALDTGLLLLLKESKNLGQYFSKFEDGERKARLKELRKNPRSEKAAAAVKEAEDLMKAAAACLSSYGG